MSKDWQSLTKSLEDLARRDPRVAAAAKSFDDTVDELNYRAALHAFRPLPWDKESRAELYTQPVNAPCTKHGEQEQDQHGARVAGDSTRDV